MTLPLLLAVVLTTSPADVDIAEAEAAYREERWSDASAAFAKAYSRTGEPALLYARAQAERHAGRCADAIPLYEEYLATAPHEAGTQAASGYLEECRQSLPPPEPLPEAVGPPRIALDDTQTQQPPAPRPWHRDPIAAVSIGVGLGALVAGSAVFGLIPGANKDGREAPDDQSYGDGIERARRLQYAGIGLVSVGGVLTLVGVVRWAVLSSQERTPSTRAAVWVQPGGFMIAGRIPQLRR